MDTAWSVEELLRPVSAEAPCGENLEETQLLGALDRLSVFGRRANYTLRGDRENGDPSTWEPDWAEVQKASLPALARSHDLRAVVHLGASALWLQGLDPFVDTLSAAAAWLENHWTDVHPRVDDDAMIRHGALLCFSDSIAIINRVRRVPLVRNRVQGAFSLRDIEIATGQLKPGESDAVTEKAEIDAAFDNASVEDLETLNATVTRGLTAIAQLSAAMEAGAGSEWTLDLSPLSNELKKIERHVASRLAIKTGVAPAEEATGEVGSETGGPVGSVRSRQDAIRALDAVAAFFRQSEPSSPIPLLVERAKRLVSKNFLEVLADIAPEALSQARSVGGLPPSGE